jgi:hypothetical protein
MKKVTKLFGPNRVRLMAEIPDKRSGHSFTGKQLAEGYDRAAEIRRADQEGKPDERRDT